jgi:putative transposase
MSEQSKSVEHGTVRSRYLRSETEFGILGNMGKKYYTGSHTKHRNMYHIVWLPKYRKKILQGKIKERLDKYLHECAEVNAWEIQELNIQLDHVHLMIQIPPSVKVCDVVNALKGASSRIVRAELPQEVRKMLWGPSFWADGYFCETAGNGASEEAIRNYIQNQ